MKRTGFIQRKTELVRSSGLSRGGALARKSTLKQVSDKQKATRSAVQRACPLDSCCVACGTSQQLTRSHILTVKQHPHQAANPLNVLTLCWPDHCIWENDKRRFQQLYPDAFALKIERMQALDPQQAALTLMKIKP